MTESTCTEAQQAEWNALMDAVEALTKRSEDRKREAGSWLAWGIDRDERDYAQQKAWFYARAARRAWQARLRLSALAEAHPYGQEVQARLDALCAARKAVA